MKTNLNSERKLMQGIISFVLIFMLLFSSITSLSVCASENTEIIENDSKSSDIVILFENDVHCAIEGYSKLSAMKNDLMNENEFVGVVSVGDFVQGDTLGAISQGEYIVNVMNMVGYDAITLGNHEFDYKLDRLYEICNSLDTKPVCSNFYKSGEDTPVFEPYVIKSYGEVDVAYIGVTTPDTLTSSSPVQFMDENGNYIYNFSGDNLYAAVQNAIDRAEAEGADYIVGLSHLGTENVYEQWSAPTLIKNTTGFDAVLDGHSHSVVESMIVEDKSGKGVAVSSTGTKFANIGKLTISDGEITTELIPTDSYTQTDEKIDEYIIQINDEYSELGSRVIGKSEVDLLFADENGNRLIRNTETNLGDFCADAFRCVTGADIGVINGGGIRAELSKGEITFNDILSVYPFNNNVCVVKVTGQQILDFLELSVYFYPEESGEFQHVSGLTYTLNSYIPSSVKFDENMAFVSVEGARRVSDVKVLNEKTGEYEAINATKHYTLASHTYLLVDHGGGATMLNDSEIVSNNGMLDVELLEVYINEHLGGVIGKEYDYSQNRAKIVTQKPVEVVPTEPQPEVIVTEPEVDADNSQKSPQTGDNNVYVFASFVFLASILAAAYTVCAFAKKQKDENK